MFGMAMRRILPMSWSVVVLAAIAAPVWAAPPGVETVIRPEISGEERVRQPDIWALEVNFKSMRMILVDVPDPKTGNTKKELIWYLPYRIVNREVKGEPAPTGPNGKRPKFIPEFELITNDNDGQHIYFDEVIPAAQAEINRREGRSANNKYKNSVEIVGEIPELTPADSKLDKSIYGVAMWRGVDPKTDFFKVFMSGFSNGFVKTPDGRIDRRTIVQEYKRPGDEIDEAEFEIRPVGQPAWIYRPSEDTAPKKP